MANIRVDLGSPITPGQGVIFRAPVNCSDITGLIVYYPQDGEVVSSVFDFADAHGNNVGGLNLFAEGALVKVLLDTELYRAYVQNPDTNEYLEKEFSKRLLAIESDEHPDCYYKEVTSEGGVVEKEWLNPPMISSQEYLTQERFLGKPVYVQVSTLRFQSTNNPTMQIPISGRNNIRCSVFVVSGTHLLNNSESTNPLTVSRGSTAITIAYEGMPSKTLTAYALLKYTKN